MPGNVQTIHVPHLGGIDAAYQMSQPYDPSKPTLVLINSFCTSSDLYTSQFKDQALTTSANLIAIELLGHGQTRTKSEHFTYWDTAIMNIQVLERLGIERWFVLGTSQGGWVTVRMALLAPQKCQGIIPLGTSMDHESPRAHSLGCWDGIAACTPSIQSWTSTKSTPDFEPSDEFIKFLIWSGFGEGCDEETKRFWGSEVRRNYKGDEGRKRARMAAINLRDRDGLHGRVGDVRCPVLWLHGTSDAVYSVKNAEEEIKMFVNSPHARLITIPGGQHFLSYSHPKEVNEHVVRFMEKYSKLPESSL